MVSTKDGKTTHVSGIPNNRNHPKHTNLTIDFTIFGLNRHRLNISTYEGGTIDPNLKQTFRSISTITSVFIGRNILIVCPSERRYRSWWKLKILQLIFMATFCNVYINPRCIDGWHWRVKYSGSSRSNNTEHNPVRMIVGLSLGLLSRLCRIQLTRIYTSVHISICIHSR